MRDENKWKIFLQSYFNYIARKLRRGLTLQILPVLCVTLETERFTTLEQLFKGNFFLALHEKQVMNTCRSFFSY